MGKRALLYFMLLFSSAVSAVEIQLLTEEYKPYQYLNAAGEATGPGVALVQAIFQRAKVPILDGQAKLYPWARTYQTLKRRKNTAAYMVTRTAAREELFRWVGPLAPRSIWLYALAGRNLPIEDLDSAKDYQLASYNRSAITDRLVALGFNHIHRTTSPSQILPMLLKQRVDLIPMLDVMAQYHVKQQQLPNDFLQPTVLLTAQEDFYLALNKQTDPVIAQKLQYALDELRCSIGYEQVFQLPLARMLAD